jgi:hypothetical protein
MILHISCTSRRTRHKEDSGAGRTESTEHDASIRLKAPDAITAHSHDAIDNIILAQVDGGGLQNSLPHRVRRCIHDAGLGRVAFTITDLYTLACY